MKVVGALLLGEMIATTEGELGGALAAWHAEACAAHWASVADLAGRHPEAEFDGDHVIFDLGHDGHCLIARVNYGVGSVLITYIGKRSRAPNSVRRRGAMTS
jgi:mRNA-degrading endonuclease HigB of HigAB toxin-antitoxin module